MRRAARSLLNRTLRKGLNGWRAMVEQRALAFAQLRAGAGAFRSRKARTGLNTLVARRQERRLAMQRLRQAGASFAGGAQTKGWRTWRASYAAARALRRPLGPVVRARMRHLLRVWRSTLSRKAPNKAIAGMLRPKRRKAFNTWSAFHSERTRMLRLLQGAAFAMSHRAARRALNCWEEVLAEWQAVEAWKRRALAAFRLRNERRAFNGLLGRKEVWKLQGTEAAIIGLSPPRWASRSFSRALAHRARSPILPWSPPRRSARARVLAARGAHRPRGGLRQVAYESGARAGGRSDGGQRGGETRRALEVHVCGSGSRGECC